MHKMILPALLLSLLGSAALAMAQQGDASARIRFVFENPKLQPANYVLDIHENGMGHFHADPGEIAAVSTDAIAPQAVDMDIQIKEPLRSFLFNTARSHNFFNVACESTKSKVAFTGKKALQYAGSDGKGSCTYNWSRDQQLMKMTDDLIAVAYTLEVGRRLAVEHEHDRLSLDTELEDLQSAAKGGRAQQLQNIAPQLQAIAEDEKVMERARSRARQLLGADGKAT